MTTATGKTELVLRKPHEIQKEIMDFEGKRLIIRAGRRGGKTTGMAALACRELIKQKRVLYAAPTSDQLQTFWYEAVRTCTPLIDSGVLYKSEITHSIGFPDSRFRLRAKTAWNADTLRGDYADVLILDEYQLMSESCWEEVGAPMLLDNNGTAYFIYTPPSFRTRSTTRARDPRHAPKLYNKAAEDTTGIWGTLHFSSHINPHISGEGLELLAQDMSSMAYRQEILAEDIDEVPGALWTRQTIEQNRVEHIPESLHHVVVGVDPPGGMTECGIVVGATATCTCRGQEELHGFILADDSLKASPDQWAKKVVNAYDAYSADRILGESNYGGDMIQATVKTASQELGIRVHYKDVRAARGKAVRADPVAALYEQGRIHHCGPLPVLEEELCTWEPGISSWSPNRLDAMVWTMTELMVKRERSNIRFIE